MDDAPILICYDGSPDAQRAIDAAAVLFADRRAVVLDVASPLTAAESDAALGPLTSDFDELNTEAALEGAQAGTEIARSAGLTAEARADLGAPAWEGVVEVADDIDAAVIVIGSRGLKGVSKLVRGSLSHELAEHAGRPVLIVPPPQPRSKRFS